jgi:hypothetical protein
MLRTLRRSRTPLLVPLLGAALFALAACSDPTGAPPPTDTATASLPLGVGHSVHSGSQGTQGGVVAEHKYTDTPGDLVTPSVNEDPQIINKLSRGVDNSLKRGITW